jgi:predicted lipase
MEQYKQYAISAMLAKFAYSSSDTLGDLWFKMRDSSRDTLSNVFKGVKEVPDFYNDKDTGAYAFSMLKDKTLYFVFRGTNDLQDAMVNIDLIRVPFFEGLKQSHIKVHGGFKRQFDVLKDGILNTLTKYMKQVETVQFVGHSLGGALATLFAGHVARFHRGYVDESKHEIKVVCHTFGSPRVGNKHFARWFQENVKASDCARIINLKDPVAQIPISAYFQHVSDAVCIMDDLTVKDLPDGMWYWRLANFKMNVCKPVLAHSCDQYIERLMKIYTGMKNVDVTPVTTPVVKLDEVKINEVEEVKADEVSAVYEAKVNEN